MVAHQAIDTQVEEAMHFALRVHGPHVNRQPQPMGNRNRACRHELDAIGAGWDLNARAGTTREKSLHARKAPGGGSKAGDLSSPERRACAGPERGTNPGDAVIGKRSDADPIDRVSALNGRNERLDGRIVLGFDIDANVGHCLEQFIQPEDRLRPADSCRLNGSPGHGGDHACPIRHTIEAIVVEGDEDAVQGRVDIGLEISEPECHCRGKRPERVLRTIIGPSSMSKADRAGVIEKGMRVDQPERRRNSPSRRRTASADIASRAARFAIIAVDSAQS